VAKRNTPGCTCCPSGPCNVTFTVRGCNSMGLPGATVTVWTDSGKATQLATGTTDSTGSVVLDITSAGSRYYEISRSRFVTFTATATISCGATVGPRTLAVATGYRCCQGYLPLPEAGLTLNYCGTGVTLVYTSLQRICNTFRSGWFATFSVTGRPYTAGTLPCACGSGAVTVGVLYECTTGFLYVSWQSDCRCNDGFPNGPCTSSFNQAGSNTNNCNQGPDSGTGTTDPINKTYGAFWSQAGLLCGGGVFPGCSPGGSVVLTE
jgi:hypothetical protein